MPLAWLTSTDKAKHGRNAALVTEKVLVKSETYTKWLRSRCGVSIPSVQWLWLPEGIASSDCAAGPSGAVVARGLAAQAEPVSESDQAMEAGGVQYQRFRCRTCQVLTHAEVHDPKASCVRTALVTSYELLRCSAASQSDEVNLGADRHHLLPAEASTSARETGRGAVRSHPFRPPQRLPWANLAEVILPAVQAGAKDLL